MKEDEKIERFLEKEVDLNPSRMENLQVRREAVEQELKKGYGNRFILIEPQGSCATNTIIKPRPDQNNEYDVDILVIIREEGAPDNAIGVLGEVERFVSDGKRNIQKKQKCVRINYVGDFHIDIVPCVKQTGGYVICNREKNKFEMSDGGAYTNWFVDIDRQHGGKISQCVKLIKYIRDYKNTFSCPSIVLTTLFGMAAGLKGTTTSITETFVLLLEGATDILQSNNVLENPVLPGENLLANVDNIENFRNQISSLAERARGAYDEEDEEKSVEKWGGIFGDKFGKKNGNRDGKNNPTISPAIPSNTLIAGTEPKHWASCNNIPVITFKKAVAFDDVVAYETNRYDAENVSTEGTTIIIDPMRFRLGNIDKTNKKTTELICEYGIKIVFEAGMKKIPMVYELYKKIPCKSDRHTNQDGSFCLELPEIIYEKMGGVFNVSIFMEEFLEPFLFYQRHVELTGKEPWKTRLHYERGYFLAVINREISMKQIDNKMR